MTVPPAVIAGGYAVHVHGWRLIRAGNGGVEVRHETVGFQLVVHGDGLRTTVIGIPAGIPGLVLPWEIVVGQVLL
ncbi:MAG: hypothetical protein IPM98_22675 [Lewinellaceae bacterium]|nr:hypothetical protein [Lewinellaceae bacterium]